MSAGGHNRGCARGSVRALSLAVLALCCVLGSAPSAWALSAGGDDTQLVLPELRLPDTSPFGLPTLYRPAERENGRNKTTPLLGTVQLAVGRAHKLSLDAFSYGGRSALLFPNLKSPTGLSLNGTPVGADDLWNLPEVIPRSALAASPSLEDQAQSFKVGLEGGRAKVSMSLRNVGAKFPAGASALQGVSQDQMKALVEAAGTRSFNLEGSLQLFDNSTFTSVRKSLYNDKPEDGNRGRTTTDWSNVLSLGLGKSTSLRFALTDHAEAWDASLDRTDTRRRTTELGGETKFGAGGKYGLRFGLTDVRNESGGKEQSQERTSEFHLALPVHARLRLNADYTRKEDGAGKGSATNFLGSVFQLYPGAELTANWKTLSPTDGKQTQETFLKFSGDFGHGGSAAHLTAEQTSTRTPDQGLLRSAKFDLNGGIGKGSSRLNLRALLQERVGDSPTDPLERLTTFHLDRAFGPHLSLTLDHEEKLKGTVATFDTNLKSAASLTATLARQTKLTAGFSQQEGRHGDGTPQLATSQDVALEHRLGALQLRVEDHRRTEGLLQRVETLAGIDWNRGAAPEWAKEVSRRHEFGDVYEYQVVKEANWLDLPFLGTRLWGKQRTGGAEDGQSSFLVSHRMLVTKRLHLQLTYHERPEYEEGDKKGHPQPLRRQFAEVDTRLGRSLVGRAWLQREQRVDDPLSLRHTLGFGLAGKLANQAQTEVYYSRGLGRWEAKEAERNVLALLYHRQLDEEHKLTVKVGYAWGLGVGNGLTPDYRLTLAYANPV